MFIKKLHTSFRTPIFPNLNFPNLKLPAPKVLVQKCVMGSLSLFKSTTRKQQQKQHFSFSTGSKIQERLRWIFKGTLTTYNYAHRKLEFFLEKSKKPRFASFFENFTVGRSRKSGVRLFFVFRINVPEFEYPSNHPIYRKSRVVDPAIFSTAPFIFSDRMCFFFVPPSCFLSSRSINWLKKLFLMRAMCMWSLGTYTTHSPPSPLATRKTFHKVLNCQVDAFL